jgi:hypothetical protein
MIKKGGNDNCGAKKGYEVKSIPIEAPALPQPQRDMERGKKRGRQFTSGQERGCRGITFMD